MYLINLTKYMTGPEFWRVTSDIMLHKNLILFIPVALLIAPVWLRAQNDPSVITRLSEPVPEIITSGANCGEPPSDAIVLFDGTSIDAWAHLNGEPVKWLLENGTMTVADSTGDIMTRDSFGDCQLHLEWRTPSVVVGEGQNRGNSGVFFMKRYEVQILDSYGNTTYVNGQAASVYKQHIPLVNACRPPGVWQTYDIIFTAPRFNQNGRLASQARITVIQNGVVVQNNVALIGATTNVGSPQNIPHDDKQPLVLQDHHCPVSFRNIWIRNL